MIDAMDGARFAQTMGLRARIYRMLGSLYFTELSDDQIELLARQDYSAFADLDADLARGAKEVERALRHVHSGTREDLAVDYAHTFLAAGTTKNERRAVPYESVYTSATGLLMEQAREDVYKAMLKERVLPDAELRTPEDHLSFECEFMAALADRAAEALEAGDIDEAARLVDVQQDFHAAHLANWVDDLCEAVDRTCRTKFYRGVALMTRGFVRMDGELLEECARLARKAA